MPSTRSYARHLFYAILTAAGMLLGALSAQAEEPQSGKEWAVLGDHAIGANNPGLAAENYVKASEAYVKERNLEAAAAMRLSSASQYVALNRKQAAIDELSKAIALKPRFVAEAYRRRGVLSEELGDHQQALADQARFEELTKGSERDREARDRFRNSPQEKCFTRVMTYMMMTGGPGSEDAEFSKRVQEIIEAHKQDKDDGSCRVANELDAFYAKFTQKAP
jgi:tetratricopeptide (TPR) repeat protein